MNFDHLKGVKPPYLLKAFESNEFSVEETLVKAQQRGLCQLYTDEGLNQFKEDLQKSFQAGEISGEDFEKGHKEIGKLQKKVITDKRGHKKTVYVKWGDEGKKETPEQKVTEMIKTFGKYKQMPSDKMIKQAFSQQTVYKDISKFKEAIETSVNAYNKYGDDEDEGKKEEDKFEHRKERAYGEVRSFSEFKNLGKKGESVRLPDYLLVNKKTNKIIAGYQSMNVPNYSKYIGPNNKSNFVIISRSTAKKPASYLDQKPIDYDDPNNWEDGEKKQRTSAETDMTDVHRQLKPKEDNTSTQTKNFASKYYYLGGSDSYHYFGVKGGGKNAIAYTKNEMKSEFGLNGFGEINFKPFEKPKGKELKPGHYLLHEGNSEDVVKTPDGVFEYTKNEMKEVYGYGKK